MAKPVAMCLSRLANGSESVEFGSVWRYHPSMPTSRRDLLRTLPARGSRGARSETALAMPETLQFGWLWLPSLRIGRRRGGRRHRRSLPARPKVRTSASMCCEAPRTGRFPIWKCLVASLNQPRQIRPRITPWYYILTDSEHSLASAVATAI